jgi:hypothetical protein
LDLLAFPPSCFAVFLLIPAFAAESRKRQLESAPTADFDHSGIEVDAADARLPFQVT